MEYIIIVTDLTNGKEETFKNLYQAKKYVEARKEGFYKYLNIHRLYNIRKEYLSINN